MMCNDMMFVCKYLSQLYNLTCIDIDRFRGSNGSNLRILLSYFK